MWENFSSDLIQELEKEDSALKSRIIYETRMKPGGIITKCIR